MSIPKTLLGARLPEGAVRYIEIARFAGLTEWAWPDRVARLVAGPHQRPDPDLAFDSSRNPLRELERWGAGDACVRALLSFGNLQELGRDAIRVATVRIGADATLPWPAREAGSLRSLRALGLERGAELLTVYGAGTWNGWLLAPNGGAAAVGSAVACTERALSLVTRAGEAFATGERAPERRGRELRAAARQDIRAASRELDMHADSRAVDLSRWRGIVSDRYWGNDLWTAGLRGTPRARASTAIKGATAAIARAIVEMRQLHDELVRSERGEPIWAMTTAAGDDGNE